MEIFWENIAKYPANIYLFNVYNKNARKSYEICSKFVVKTSEQRPWRSVTFSKVAT